MFLRQRWFGVALAAAMGIALAAGPAAAQTRPAPESQLRFNPTFAKNPPRVLSASIQSVDPAQWGGRTVMLKVDYDPADRRVSRHVLTDFGTGPVVLRDDGLDGDAVAGDRQHTGVFTFDLGEREARRSQLMEYVLEGFDTVSDFHGRELVGTHPLLEDIAAMATQLKWTGVSTAATDPFATLMIVDPMVVNDPTRTIDPCTGIGNPNGVWTFGYVMDQMAALTTMTTDQFVRNWMGTWATTQTVNGWSVPPRNHIKAILDDWAVRSGGSVTSTLDMGKAPFRLLAIVNRVDLRTNGSYGGGSAGEARLVYGLVEPTGGCVLRKEMTVIFEFKIQIGGCPGVRAWAKQWHDLQLNPTGSAAYNIALEAITRQFTDAGSDPFQLPNQSTLGQLRTNEIEDPVTTFNMLWEMREFNLDSTGNLKVVTVKETPDTSLNGKPPITGYINSLPITGPLPVLPNNFPGTSNPLLGGRSITPGGPNPPPIMTWGPSTSVRRHDFSIGTCSGCHSRDTNTLFVHIDPSKSGIASLSGFLTGAMPPVVDPVSGVSRQFDDLTRRVQDLDALVFNACVDGIFLGRQGSTH